MPRLSRRYLTGNNTARLHRQTMDAWSNELRLALTLLLNAAVFACAFRLARRRGDGGMLQTACDAFLLYFVVQYVAVALPGAPGLFNLWTMSLIAFGAAALMWITAGSPPFNRTSASSVDSRACPPRIAPTIP